MSDSKPQNRFIKESDTISSGDDVNYMRGLGLESNISTAATDRSELFYYQRGAKDVNADIPILVLIHGYPQSSFMWRHVIPLLPANIPLFIPDIPGYGRSAPLSGPQTLHNKQNVGNKILETLRTILPNANATQPIIICGHDRGARICHRLAVDRPTFSNFKVLGSIFLDIVPTLIQWQSFSNASSAAATFHWPFLANVELATAMINAQGGDVWVRTCLNRWAGRSEAGLKKLKENGAMKVYEEFFINEGVIRASCDDYRAGANEDVELQQRDQEAGRKLDSDVLVIYSADYLGKRYDVKEIWEEWMGNGDLEVSGVEDHVGHFIAEEAPEVTVSAIVRFCHRHM